MHGFVRAPKSGQNPIMVAIILSEAAIVSAWIAIFIASSFNDSLNFRQVFTRNCWKKMVYQVVI